MTRRARFGFIALAVPFTLIGFWLISTALRPDVAPMETPADIVVLVVLDGVRPDELLAGPDPRLSEDAGQGSAMPFLMGELVPQGVFLGRSNGAPGFRLGNPVGISMPSYHSILTGRLTACVSNDCGAPWGGNLLSDIMQAFQSDADAVGFYSASGNVCAHFGVSSRAGRALCGTPDGPARPDAEVFAAALEHLRTDPPRFLYIGLEHSDTVGHGGDYARFLEVLSEYDDALRQLDAAMDTLNRKASLLVTTDHGRGQGREWTEHRWNVAGTSRLWLYAGGHGIASRGVIDAPDSGSLYDIRATVMHLLGLTPPSGPLQGRVITRILDQS